MGLVDQKVVVITGGAQGIGLCAAERFAQEGARVAIWDFNEEKGRASAGELAEKNYDVRFQQVNVTDMDSVSAAAQALFRDAGKIDVQQEPPSRPCQKVARTLHIFKYRCALLATCEMLFDLAALSGTDFAVEICAQPATAFTHDFFP